MKPFSRTIFFIAAICAIIALYLTWSGYKQAAYFAILPIIVLGIVYTMSPQIDWWYYSKRPPQLDKSALNFLQKEFSFYSALSPDEQLRFRQRVALFEMAVDFKPQGFEIVPADIRLMIAAEAVRLTFGLNDFRIGAYENIVVYPHPFPSPMLPALHPSETHHEDKVIVLSAQHIAHAFVEPSKFYNIALHELSGAWLHSLNYVQPLLSENDIPTLEKISGFSNQALQKMMVFPLEAQINQVAITYFFSFPKAFKQHLPDTYRQISHLLQIDPLSGRQPSMTSVP